MCVRVRERESQALTPTRTHKHTSPHSRRAHCPPRAHTRSRSHTHTSARTHAHTRQRSHAQIREGTAGCGGSAGPAVKEAERRCARSPRGSRTAVPGGRARSCRSREPASASAVLRRAPPSAPTTAAAETRAVAASQGRVLRADQRAPGGGAAGRPGRGGGAGRRAGREPREPGGRAPRPRGAGSPVPAQGQPSARAVRLQPAPVLPPHVRSAPCSLQPAACRRKIGAVGPWLRVGAGRIPAPDPALIPTPCEGPVKNGSLLNAHTHIKTPRITGICEVCTGAKRAHIFTTLPLFGPPSN